ncbi:ATP-dependent helicase HrpB [Psychromonas ossibalaenae]|uniref:ATP-dependent helicase HrpB n=1 Tax=Psychromonas ossibalaenae TaxID=444922 RepID=UPI000366BE3A|nr:ATP-dependent helicase HrpB [Psychromonas ossibalaenae]
MPSLPIESVIKQLQSSLLLAPQVILQAPPGAGKSTFLPFTMVKEQWFSGRIIMLEPRRLAAKNIAYYLSSLLKEPVGGRVGYRMRGENKTSKDTRLEIVTEGVLTRMLQHDPELNGVDLLIFDEFHERNLQADLGLALALDIQGALREDLKLLIMSATLDNSSLYKQLPDALCISSEGRSFPIDYFYQSSSKQTLVPDLVKLIKRAYQERAGNILVFVAGIKEIKQCESLLRGYFDQLPDKLLIAPLYGALTLDEQQKAIANCPSGFRKIVIATNIAETSLTIEGITVVVDSGFERCMSYQVQSGIGKLHTQRISSANATQRAGRAGRLSHGACYRLWSEETRLNKQASPEINRSDLTSLVLEVFNWGVTDLNELSFITQPAKVNVDVAKCLLKSIGAVDAKERCTRHGQAIIKLGVNPRLGHLLLRAVSLQKDHHITGLVELACLLAALLESNEKGSDDIEQGVLRPSSAVKQQQSILLKKLTVKKTGQTLPLTYCGLLLALAYPDRIAKARDLNNGIYLLSNGTGASLLHESNLIGQTMLVAADLALSDRTVNSLIYKACPVSLEMIQTYLPHYLSEQDYICWQLSTKKLIAEKRLNIGSLQISKRPLANVSNEQKSSAVLSGIRQAGLAVLSWSDEDKQLLSRLRYAFAQLSAVNYKIDFPDFSEQVLLENCGQWLAPYLNGVTKPEQLKRLDLKGALLSRLSWSVLQIFNELFPTTIKVPTGSTIKISYRDDEAPVLSVRMQELFGQQETPCIFGGRIQLQLALLSPAMRPLQLTQDLGAFWQGAYTEVKKEMRGRYPKHYWPDNPLEAVATRRTKKHLEQK